MSQTVVFHKIYNKILEIFKENGYNPMIDDLLSLTTMGKWYMHNRWIKKQYD